MSKENSNENQEPELEEIDDSGHISNGNIDPTIDMAAELFAELFWRHWLYIKKQKKEK